MFLSHPPIWLIVPLTTASSWKSFSSGSLETGSWVPVLLLSRKPFSFLVFCRWPAWFSYLLYTPEVYKKSIKFYKNLLIKPQVLKYHGVMPGWGSITFHTFWGLHGGLECPCLVLLDYLIISSPPFSLCSLSPTPSSQILAFLELSFNSCSIFSYFFFLFLEVYLSLSSYFSSEFLISDIRFLIASSSPVLFVPFFKWDSFCLMNAISYLSGVIVIFLNFFYWIFFQLWFIYLFL